MSVYICETEESGTIQKWFLTKGKQQNLREN